MEDLVKDEEWPVEVLCRDSRHTVRGVPSSTWLFGVYSSAGRRIAWGDRLLQGMWGGRERCEVKARRVSLGVFPIDRTGARMSNLTATEPVSACRHSKLQ